MRTRAADREMSSMESSSNSLHERIISLSLTEDYAPSWGVWEGVRELIQNWHDGCLDHGDQLSFTRADLRCADAGAVFHCHSVLSGACIGSLVYDASKHELKIVNRDVALHRKVLLLGSSHKAVTHEAIGQFGEGMKVGTLALLREGRSVSMSTRDEHWQWLRQYDQAFDTRVLTVAVTQRALSADDGNNEVVASVVDGSNQRDSASPTERDVEVRDSDTVTLVAPLAPDEWKRFVTRFLFLAPPSDLFRCELGDLLLDARLASQLYVKGIWIADLAEDGLGSGLNFRSMRLDRDRRAVLHLSDLESQAAAMWVRALDKRPELAATLYGLLAAPQPAADVRRVAEFLSTSDRPTAVQALVDEFFRAHHADGASTPLPLAHSDTQALKASLSEVENRLKRRVVMVSPALLACLRRSEGIPELAEIEAGLRDTAPLDAARTLPVAWADADGETQRAVRDAVALAIACGDERLEVGLIDLVSQPHFTATMREMNARLDTDAARSPRVEVAVEAFSLERAHNELNGCVRPSGAAGGACSCRGAVLFRLIVQKRSAHHQHTSWHVSDGVNPPGCDESGAIQDEARCVVDDLAARPTPCYTEDTLITRGVARLLERQAALQDGSCAQRAPDVPLASAHVEEEMMGKEVARRELLLRHELMAAEERCVEQVDRQSDEIRTVQAELRRLTRLLDEKEVKEVNESMLHKQAIEREVKKAYDARMTDLQGQVSALEAKLADAEERSAHSRTALSAAQEKAARERKAHATLEGHLRGELEGARRRLIVRTEQLLSLAGEAAVSVAAAATSDSGGGASDGGGGNADGSGARAPLTAELLEAAREIHEQAKEEREAHRCAVCLEGEREAVLLPCRHAVLCTVCSGLVQATSGRCPVCRVGIAEVMPIFR